MSLAFYKVFHLFGVALLFTGVGGLCILSVAASESPRAKRLASIVHGLALVILLVTGFGLLAKLGMGATIPLWLWLKIAIWLVLGGVIVLIKRTPQYAGAMLFALPVLGAIAAYLAIYKFGG